MRQIITTTTEQVEKNKYINREKERNVSPTKVVSMMNKKIS
jgi:hypothetical protein